MLPIMFGNATKLGKYLPVEPKRYTAQLRLGQATDTDDSDGQTTVSAPVPAGATDQARLDDLCGQHLTGTIWQTPPHYSAIRVDGVRAYTRARRGETFEVPPRQVTVHRIQCSAVPGDPTLVRMDFPSDISCSR